MRELTWFLALKGMGSKGVPMWELSQKGCVLVNPQEQYRYCFPASSFILPSSITTSSGTSSPQMVEPSSPFPPLFLASNSQYYHQTEVLAMKLQAKGEGKESNHSKIKPAEQTITCPNCRHNFKAAIDSLIPEQPKLRISQFLPSVLSTSVESSREARDHKQSFLKEKTILSVLKDQSLPKLQELRILNQLSLLKKDCANKNLPLASLESPIPESNDSGDLLEGLSQNKKQVRLILSQAEMEKKLEAVELWLKEEQAELPSFIKMMLKERLQGETRAGM